MHAHSPADPKPSFFRRYGLWVVIVTFALLPVGILEAFKTLRNLQNDTADWLPATFAETREYKWFIRHFETDEILVVSWDGCTIDDKRLDKLAEEVARAKNTNAQGETYPWFQFVTTGRDVRDRLLEQPLERISNESQRQSEALRRMRGWLVGADDRTTCAILVVNPHTVYDQARGHAVNAVINIATEQLGIPRASLHLGGPTIDTVAVDSESVRSLYLLMTLSIGSGLLLSWWFLGSWRLVTIVVVTASMCELWSLAMVSLLGSSMDMVLIMMPALVYILGVSGCIHQLNYYLEEARRHGVEGAAGRSLAHCWQPSALATGTTALGLVSLVVGDVVPIRKFGAFAALGVILSVVFLFLFLPSLLEVWRPRSKYQRSQDELSMGHHSPSRRISLALANFGVRYYRPILVICLVAMPGLGWGILQTRTSVKMQHLFSERAEILQNYRWLEEHIGALIPVEVVIQFPHANSMSMLDRLKLVERVRAKIQSISAVGSTVSAATFAPPIPVGSSSLQAGARGAIQHFLVEHRDRLKESRYLSDEVDEQGNPQNELWRISARVKAFTDIDYADFLHELNIEVEPILREVDAQLQPQEYPQAHFSGGVPLVSLVQRRMLNDLASSFTTAFVTIAITMAVMLRTLGGSLVMMIPNVLPPLLVFGLLGWSGTFVDLGSMMTISTALGISVDNELHFYAWFRRAVKRGAPYSQAVMSSFHHCGSAMAETSIICSLGLAAFALSPFVPVSRFGWLMFLLIGTAMIGDLVVMPALLASPLGWFFGRPRRTAGSDALPMAENDEDPLESDVPAGAGER